MKLILLLVSCAFAFPQNFDLSVQEDELPSTKAFGQQVAELAERYLTEFDVTLASKIKPYVTQLNEKQQDQFLKDIKELNEAIEEEILTELVEKMSSEGSEENDDVEGMYGSIAKKVIDRTMAKNQNKLWLSRLMNFAGNEVKDTARKLRGI